MSGIRQRWTIETGFAPRFDAALLRRSLEAYHRSEARKTARHDPASSGGRGGTATGGPAGSRAGNPTGGQASAPAGANIGPDGAGSTTRTPAPHFIDASWWRAQRPDVAAPYDAETAREIGPGAAILVFPAAAQGQADAEDRAVPSRARLLLKATGYCALAALGAAALAPPILAYVRRDQVAQTYAALNASATAVSVVDNSGHLLGLRAQPGRERVREFLPSAPLTGNFFSFLEFLEDRHRGNPLRDYFGYDPVTLARSAACVVARMPVRWVIGRSWECTGASSLEMQAARGTNGWYGGQNDNLSARKATELLDAPALSLVYSRATPQGRQFIADSLTYGYVAGGYELWGLRLSSLLIFGREPDHLSDAQQAVLASAPRYRLVLRCAAPASQTLTTDVATWKKIKARARLAIEGRFSTSDPGRATALAELDHMARPVEPQPLDPVIAAQLPDQARCLVAANPHRSADILAGAELTAAAPELAGFSAGSAPITDLQLTTDFTAQLAFKRQVVAALRAIEQGQRGHMMKPLTGKGAADVVVAVTRPDGAIDRLYSNSERAILDEQRWVGSIGKLVVATTAAIAGRDPGQPLCNHRDPGGIQNAGGSAGSPVCSGSAMIPVQVAFGKSMNLPVLDLARSLPSADLAAVARAFRITLPAGRPIAQALTLGMADSNPRAMLADAMAVSRAAAGLPAQAAMPHIVARVRRAASWVTLPSPTAVTLPAGVASARARHFLEVAARAAVRLPGGTLHSAATPVGPLEHEVGKTGTIASDRPRLATRAKLALGAVPDKGAWTTIISAQTDAFADRYVSVVPLNRLARGTMAARK